MLGQVAVPTVRHEKQNGYGPDVLGHNTSWQVPGLGASHVRLDCSSSWQAQVMGLGKCLAKEL